MIRAEHGGDVVFRDQAERLLLADLRIALMIGFVELDLGAAEVGQPSRRPERQVLEVGIGVVDDIDVYKRQPLRPSPSAIESALPLAGKRCAWALRKAFGSLPKI